MEGKFKSEQAEQVDFFQCRRSFMEVEVHLWQF